MGTHFDQQCPHCDYTSRTEGRLKRHIKDFHSDELDSAQSRREQNKPKILRCRQCNFSSHDKVIESAMSIREISMLKKNVYRISYHIYEFV